MTGKEKNKISTDLIEKIKSIPQLGPLYNMMSRIMPGLMETVIEQSMKELNFLDKTELNVKEILLRCYYLLEKFYFYYGIDCDKLFKNDGTHSIMIYEDIKKLPDDAKKEYSIIWQVIKRIQYRENILHSISPSDLHALNNFYKKYNSRVK
jgi:hypothetical protein